MGRKIANIYHSIDMDGYCSSSIVQRWFTNKNVNNQLTSNNPYHDILFKKNDDKSMVNKIPKINSDDVIEFIGYNHGDKEPDLSEYEIVIICDICLSMETMKQLYNRIGDNLIWIDHHISAIKDIEAAGINVINGIRDIKFAGCGLTWQFFFPNQKIPVPVYLLDRYDCFGFTDDEKEVVLAFQYYARSEASSKDTIPYWWLDNITVGNNKPGDPLTSAVNSGRTIKKYLDTDAGNIMKRAFKMDIAGYKFLVVNQERFNPINFGIDYHNIDNVGYDGFACFHYDGTSNKWCWSFYNDNGKVDCSKVVRSIKTDSGGHAGAAGMKLTNDEQFDFISEKI